MQNSDLKSVLKSLDQTFDLYLIKKAPTIPPNIRELLVTIAPWFTLIGIVLSIPGILILLGLGTLFAPFAVLGGVTGAATLVSFLLFLPALVLQALAIPGLFNKSKQGWNFLFYATLLNVVQNILTVNLAGLIIGGLLSLYILYQIKTYYK